MKWLFCCVIIGVCKAGFEMWTVRDELPTSGGDCDQIMDELALLVCGSFEECRVRNCTVQKVGPETTTGSEVTSPISTTAGSTTSKSTEKSTTTTTATTTKSTTTPLAPRPVTVEGTLKTNLAWSPECQTTHYLAECHYCQIQSDLNNIFYKNFDFIEKTEFGKYDGVEIKSFSDINSFLVVNFQFTFETSDEISDVILLYDDSLQNVVEESVVEHGQTCDGESCTVTEMELQKEPKVEVTWFIKSYIETSIKELDDCVGTGSYSSWQYKQYICAPK